MPAKQRKIALMGFRSVGSFKHKLCLNSSFDKKKFARHFYQNKTKVESEVIHM